MNQKIQVTTIIHFHKLSENEIEPFPKSPPADVIIEYSSCPVCGEKFPKEEIQNHIKECCDLGDDDF